MNDGQRQAAVNVLIAEYTALRAEAVERVKTQSHVVHWMLLLTGGAIGLLLTKNLPFDGGMMSLSVDHVNRRALGYFIILAAGYVTGIELLIAYWAFQLYMLFRISLHIEQLGERAKRVLEIDLAFPHFGWEIESRASAVEHRVPVGLKAIAALHIAPWLDVLPPIVMAGVGLVGLGMGALLSIIRDDGVLLVIALSLFGLLSVSLLALHIVRAGLCDWICRQHATQ